MTSTGTRGTRIVGALALVALAATAVQGLTLPETREQAEYSRLLAIHPAIAWTAYLAFGITALCSALYLWPRTRRRLWDVGAGASAEVGVVFTALTLVTGMLWGRPTWGVWWTWDARLTTTALMLALYLGYLALRRVPAAHDVRAERTAWAALAAVLVIPVNHMAVEWWRTLHQGRTLATLQPDLDGRHLAAMLTGIAAFTLAYAWLLVHRARVALLEERLGDVELQAAIDERRAEAGEPVGAPT